MWRVASIVWVCCEFDEDVKKKLELWIWSSAYGESVKKIGMVIGQTFSDMAEFWFKCLREWKS